MNFYWFEFDDAYLYIVYIHIWNYKCVVRLSVSFWINCPVIFIQEFHVNKDVVAFASTSYHNSTLYNTNTHIHTHNPITNVSFSHFQVFQCSTLYFHLCFNSVAFSWLSILLRQSSFVPQPLRFLFISFFFCYHLKSLQASLWCSSSIIRISKRFNVHNFRVRFKKTCICKRKRKKEKRNSRK